VDPRLAVTPAAGILRPSDPRQALRVKADLAGLPPGTVWTGDILFTPAAGVDPQDRRSPTPGVRVAALVPFPDDLARRARPRASSSWSAEYGPERLVDGDPATRWNSRRGERDGAWVELAWPRPLAVDTVVLDECTDFGPRVRAWRLEGGDETLRVLARGAGLGARHVLHLERTARLRRLRLVVERATETPTLWALEAYCWR
jgi:hypothetical protein